MHIRKIVLSAGLLVIFGFLFSFNIPSAHALTAGEIQALIEQLQQQIVQLQQQLAEQQGQPVAFCYDFNTNLGFAHSGTAAVEALHTALEKQGFSVGSDSTNGAFTENTASAVVGFQQKYKEDVLAPYGLRFGTGFVGKATRAKLNRLYGCAATSAPVTPVPTPTPTPIPTPSITVLSPNAWEKWWVGSTYTIKWASSNLPSEAQNKIGISLFLRDTTTGIPIANNIANDGSENWTIPSSILSGEYKITVGCYIAEAGCYSDSSDYYFVIASPTAAEPSITVSPLNPNGETLQKGTTRYVNLKFSPSVPLGGFVVNLMYSNIDAVVAHLKFCGTANDYIADSVVPPNVSWQWKVGYDVYGIEIPNGSYRISVYDCGNKLDNIWTGSVTSAKSSVFSIVSATATTPSVTVLSPNGGEQLQVGNTYRIRWNSASMYNVKIYIVNGTNTGSGSTNYVIPYNNAWSASTGYYDWTITSQQLPIGTSNARYKIRIDSDENSSIFDSSDDYFTIIGAQVSAPSITVLSPNGGEQLQKGATQTITWSSSNVSQVYIKLRKGTDTYHGTEGAVSDIISNTGSYQWTIPTTLPDGSDYSIRVVDSAGSISDDSDTNFRIASQAVVIPTVNVSLDSSTPQSVALVPDQANIVFAKIRLTAGIDPVNNMNGIQVGSDAFDASNYFTNIKVFDGTTQIGQTVTSLLFNGNYYYAWVSVSGFSIPANSSKILDVIADVKSGVSNNSVRLGIAGWNFNSPGAYVIPYGSIYGNKMTVASPNPSITVLSPNGGESWQIGETHNITWSYSGPADKLIQIELGLPAADGLGIVSNVYANAQSYSWQVPIDIPARSDYRVIIREIEPTYTFLDSSDNYFSVTPAPSITVLEPNGGESLLVPGETEVTWKSTGISADQPINIISLVGVDGTEWYLRYDAPNDGYEIVNLPSFSKSGSFKIKLETSVNKQQIIDLSDNYFNLIPPPSN